MILLMEEILHHLAYLKPYKHGKNYLSTGAGFLPSTVSESQHFGQSCVIASSCQKSWAQLASRFTWMLFLHGSRPFGCLPSQRIVGGSKFKTWCSKFTHTYTWNIEPSWNQFVLCFSCWTPWKKGIIKLPILVGPQTMQIYGDFEGFPLIVVPCLGW